MRLGWPASRAHRVPVLIPGLLAALACQSPAPSPPADPLRYRLTRSGSHWDLNGDDRVLDDLQPRYPEFFALTLDPSRSEEANLLLLRNDLELQPADRRNYDALNAVAIAYFEMNYRGESERGQGLGFMSRGFHAAKLLAVPWRAYDLVAEAELRDAILDFYQDAATGEKLGTLRTAPRLTRIVASLRRRETDPTRIARIDRIVARLETIERQLLDVDEPANDPLDQRDPQDPANP